MTPAALSRLYAAAFRDTRGWSEAECAALMAQNGVTALGDHRCCVLIRMTLDEAEILTLATHPQHCRQGLARATLQHAEHAATAAEVTQIFLEVAEDNSAAHALYLDAGYRQVGYRTGYYAAPDGKSIAALVLRKDLNPAKSSKKRLNFPA